MSLVSLALRIATVRLLRGATFANARVHDSMIDPASLLDEDAEPFIVVAVDSDEKEPTGRDLLGASRTTLLVLDMAVASKVTVPQPTEGEPEHVIGIPHTDAGMEVVLDFMMRQVERALLTSANPWSKVWRTLAPKITKVQSDRGAATDKGVRFAARQVVLTLETMAEPSFAAPEGVWGQILSLMREDEKLADLADLLEQEISTPDLEGWARGMADLGLLTDFSLGGDPDPLLPPPPQPVTGATIQFDGGEWTEDADTIDDALGPNPDQT